MRSLLARNETARFTTISGFKSYIFLINQSFWTGSLCFSNRKYTKIADSIKKSADIHYHVNKNTVLLIWCVALGQYIVVLVLNKNRQTRGRHVGTSESVKGLFDLNMRGCSSDFNLCLMGILSCNMMFYLVIRHVSMHLVSCYCQLSCILKNTAIVYILHLT